MGCAGIKIAKRAEFKRCVEVPNFKLKKTRNSSNSASPSDFLIFMSDVKSKPKPNKAPLLNIEANRLRNKRLMNISRSKLTDV